MKNNIYIFLFLLSMFINNSIHSQALLLGLKGGFISSAISSADPNYIMKSNVFVGGITIDYKIYKYFYFSSEINCEQRGLIIDNPAFGPLKLKCNPTYIALPLIAKCKFGNRFKFVANIGVAPSILIKNDRSPEFDYYTTIIYNDPVNNSVEYHKFDVYGLIGTGIEYKINDRFITSGEFRFTKSFIDYEKSGYFSGHCFYTFNFLLGVYYIIK